MEGRPVKEGMSWVHVQPRSQPEQPTAFWEFKGCIAFFMVWKSGKSPSCSLSCAPTASSWEQQWHKFQDYSSITTGFLPLAKEQLAGGVRRPPQVVSGDFQLCGQLVELGPPVWVQQASLCKDTQKPHKSQHLLLSFPAIPEQHPLPS